VADVHECTEQARLPMKLSAPQRGVALGMVCGLVIAAASLGTAGLLQPFGSLPDTVAARVQVFALSALVPAALLAACIARLAAHRFRTPQDLDGSGLTQGTEQAKLLQALLQNTLEQLALALPAYAAWAVFASAHLLDLELVAALMFLCGRILFFWGYARGAPGRALGFALTFYPTVLLLIGAIALGARVPGH
jgi:hypothetical protein